MNNLEDIKSKWQALNHASSPDMLESTRINPMRHRSQLSKVKRTFTILSIVCAICSFIVPGNLHSLGFSMWGSLMTCIFFIAALGFNLWLLHTADKIDLSNHSSTTVLEAVTLLTRRRLTFRWVLMPMALLIVGYILYHVSNDMYMLLGAICGGITGLIIGLFVDRNIRHQLKSIADDLKSVQQ